MVHPDTELRFISAAIGWGVFATRPIPRGTITWALDALDQRFTPAQFAALPPYARALLDKYSYVDAAGRHILCWDHARFFNHSCAANCLSVGYDFELAVRDIAAGEELTDDYGTLKPYELFPLLWATEIPKKRSETGKQLDDNDTAQTLQLARCYFSVTRQKILQDSRSWLRKLRDTKTSSASWLGLPASLAYP